MSPKGSSPLTRGKPCNHASLQLGSRLIPAHAGKTPRCDAQHALSRAHPRSRGENIYFFSALHRRGGSSPLTRGKQYGIRACVCEGGLIPAHAGKTTRAARPAPPVTAHPRSRGENVDQLAATPWKMGSSPLTRGKLPNPGHARPPGGLIPAHAGKTSRPRMKPSMTRAHPRSRGENPSRASAKASRNGSSPLTRGKRHECLWARVRQGLIPAHAGKTSPPRTERGGDRAHPRSRGENLEKLGGSFETLGSSPLTRGKPVRVNRDRAVLGLIPAHAGKTPRSSLTSSPGRAHPRSRGEN